MMSRGVPSWQLVLADLSLILFIVTAGALARSEESVAGAEEHRASGLASTGAPVSGSPVAVLRGDGSADDDVILAAWLAEYRPDPREQLTLTLHYGQGDFAAAQARAEAMRGLSMDAGQIPRIVLEQADTNALHASFAFDHAPDVARNLQ